MQLDKKTQKLIFLSPSTNTFLFGCSTSWKFPWVPDHKAISSEIILGVFNGFLQRPQLVKDIPFHKPKRKVDLSPQECQKQRSRSFADGGLGLAVQSLRQDCALRLSSLPSTGNQDDSDQGLDLYLAHFSNESRTPNFYRQITCPKHIKIAKTEQEARKAAFHLQN